MRPLALWWRGVRTWSDAWAYGLLAFTVVGALHLAEVHLVDARAAALARSWAGGWDFGAFARLEEPLTLALGGLSPPVVAGVAAYYLAAFVTLLALVPALVAAHGDPRLLRRTLLAYPVLYALALPWFLLFPSVNPYTRLGAPGPFEAIHPMLEEVYYWLTTRDNTFPSLHVAFTAVLVAQAWRTRWTFLRATLLAHGVLLVASVVVIRVHYVADVAGGLVAAWLALRVVDACLAREGALSGVGRALDSACARWSPRRTRAYARVAALVGEEEPA